MVRCSAASVALTLRRRLLPFLHRERARCAIRIRRSARRDCRALAISSPVDQSGQRRNTDVDANRRAGMIDRARNLNCQQCKPKLAFPFDLAGYWFRRQWAMEVKADGPDTLHTDAAAGDSPAGAVKKTESFEPFATTEPREPGAAALGLGAAKEGCKCEIDLLQRPPLHRHGVYGPRRIAAQFGQFFVLVLPTAAVAGLAIAVDPLTGAQRCKDRGCDQAPRAICHAARAMAAAASCRSEIVWVFVCQPTQTTRSPSRSGPG